MNMGNEEEFQPRRSQRYTLPTEVEKVLKDGLE
jgi:hypothetical protein